MHPSSYLLYMNHTHNTKMKNLQMIILLNEFIVQNVPSYDLSVKENNIYIIMILLCLYLEHPIV